MTTTKINSIKKKRSEIKKNSFLRFVFEYNRKEKEELYIKRKKKKKKIEVGFVNLFVPINNA